MDDDSDDRQSSRRARLRVRIKPDAAETAASQPTTASSDEEKADVSVAKDTTTTSTVSALFKVVISSPYIQWIPANWSWSKGKPVIRSASAAWVALVLFLIPEVLDMMGQAAFLIIIASFLSPPSDPFVAVLERELLILTIASLGWAWSCLGLFFANLARSNKTSTPVPAALISGKYIEAGPTVIMAIFLFIGSVFILFLKSHFGPGPFLLAAVFGCICIDIFATTAVLYPFPFYLLGKIVVVPLALHSAIAITFSVCFFPSSMSAIFTRRLHEALSALVSSIQEHQEQLQQDVSSPDFSAASTVAAVDKAEGVLPLLAAADRLLKVDIIYSRFAPTDYAEIYSQTRQLIIKANGMNMYYTMIDPTRERFPVTPAPSTPVTPGLSSPTTSRPPSPSTSRPPSPERDIPSSPEGRPRRHRFHSSPHSHLLLHPSTGLHRRRRRHSPHRPVSESAHSSLLHLALTRAARRTESPVGVFESHRYLNLEAVHMTHPDSKRYVEMATENLRIGSEDLLNSSKTALQGVCDWLASVGDNRFNFWVGREGKQKFYKERIKKYEDLHSELSRVLQEFVDDKRLGVCEPYTAMFASTDDVVTERDKPPHRHLFHCYVFQFHLMRFATGVQNILSEIIRLENEREIPRVWLPRFNLSKLMPWTRWEPSELIERDDDEDPDMIPGLDPTATSDLGKAVPRDPDALPPRNALESIMNWIYRTGRGLGGGNVIFAVKGGILTILLSLPSFFKSSAKTAFVNKFVWAVIMGQFTLARFRGDTTFGLLARLFSTFVGCLVGTVMWYISAGSGKGNAYGLAAVCLVCFPAFFFFAMYWPVPQMTKQIIFVTAALVFGYSYQDTHLVTPASPGFGINVAWRRLVLVVVGVMAAGVFSFLPPSKTIRGYQRGTLATTASELGSAYCSVVSFANTKREDDTTIIVQRLLAIQSKLKRSIVLKTNVVYEFSLRGRWPAERYQRILELQISILNQLSHLTSVVVHLEPAWTNAFLKRTRMLDADFQGDILAVITMIAYSLRTGNPLPQVTPCPLLHRFMERRHGFNVIHEEAEEDFGLPRMVTSEMLESLQYLIFCVGVSTAFGIVISLDKLMVAAKELVGEQYHIDGVGIPLYHQRMPGTETHSL